MWDDRRSPGHKNVCLLDTSKLRNRVFLRKCSKWNSNFQNWSKVLCLDVFEPTKWLAVQNTIYVLRNRQGKKAFLKGDEKKYLCK